jgi:hypothetical protein
MKVDRASTTAAAELPSASAPAPGRPFTIVGGEEPSLAPAPALPAGPLSPAPAAASAPTAGSGATRFLTRLLEDERAVDAGLRAAMSGRMLSAQELLVLQAQVIQYSQAVDVVSRIVDKATGAVKQVLQTPL